MISSENFQPASNKKSFSPCLFKTLKVQEESQYICAAGFSIYNQKYNMLIVSPANLFVHFFDATTLSPIEGRDSLKFKNRVTNISFVAEDDVYIFASVEELYAYDLASKELTPFKSFPGMTEVLSLTFISPVHFVFSTKIMKRINSGSLEKKELSRGNLQNDCDSFFLYTLKHRRILLSGMDNGDLIVYRTDRFPKLSRFCSIQAQRNGSYVAKIEIAKINQKEFILTCGSFGSDHVIRLWRIIKGRIRLVRAIVIGERIFGLACLNEEKMIAVTSGRSPNNVKFFSLISGKLEYTLDLKMARARHIFVMKDKNAIGVTNFNTETIKVIKLRDEGVE